MPTTSDTTGGRSRPLLRWKNVFLLVVAVLVINLPPAQSAYQRHRLSAGGVDVRAAVVQQRTLGGDYFVTFDVPGDTPSQGDASFRGTARVDQRTYDAAAASGRIEVRVLSGSTSTWRAAGQIDSRLGPYVAGAADLLLLLILLVYVRFRSRLRPTLVLVAEGDLEPGAPEAALERIAGQRYVVCGTVHTVEADAVSLVVGDRRVRVLLDGHRNPVGPGHPVCATGTMIA